MNDLKIDRFKQQIVELTVWPFQLIEISIHPMNEDIYATHKEKRKSAMHKKKELGQKKNRLRQIIFVDNFNTIN